MNNNLPQKYWINRKILHIENICIDKKHQKKRELVKNYIIKLYN